MDRFDKSIISFDIFSKFDGNLWKNLPLKKSNGGFRLGWHVLTRLVFAQWGNWLGFVRDFIISLELLE